MGGRKASSEKTRRGGTAGTGWLADGNADRGFACPGRRSTRNETAGRLADSHHSSPPCIVKGGLVDICNGRCKGLLVVVICSFAVLVAAAPDRGRERRPPSGCRCAGTVVQVEECDMAPCCITTRTTALVDE